MPEGNTDYRKKAGNKLPTAESLILELQVVAQSIGRTPTTTIISELSKEGRAHSLNSYYAVFGSFLKAVKRANLKPRYKQEFDDADRERMLDELRRLQKRLKRPIFDEDVDEARRREKVSPPYHLKLAFGSVPQAIAKAGAGARRWTRTEIIEFLKRLDKKLERAVLERDIQREFHAGRGPSDRAVVREFGGILRARLVAAVRKR